MSNPENAIEIPHDQVEEALAILRRLHESRRTPARKCRPVRENEETAVQRNHGKPGGPPTAMPSTTGE
jgi:hypothetical protein